jgi:hypothetical protein
VDIDPRKDEGADPLAEGDVEDPDEVDVEENVEEAGEDEGVL